MIYDQTGNRKYLTTEERKNFIRAAERAPIPISTFCLTLAFTGARISEVLALFPRRIDFAVRGITFETMKRRRPGIYRTVPVPDDLLTRLEETHSILSKQSDPRRRDELIWPWCRTTAWKRVKEVMKVAGVQHSCDVPKSLRHGFGIAGTIEAGIPLNIIQKWMGHARIETTAIYANAVGPEERRLAGRMWPSANQKRQSGREQSLRIFSAVRSARE